MITLIQSPPNDPMFVGQKLIFIASSTETAEDNFKYNVVVEYPFAATDIEIYNGLFDPNPSGDLIFDLSPIIRDRMAMDVVDEDGNLIFEMPHTTGVMAVDSIKACEFYKVTINEYYGDPAEVVLSGITVVRNYVAGAFNIRDGFEPSVVDYLPSFPNTTKGWWTGRNLVNDEIVIKVSDEDYGVIGYGNYEGIYPTHALYQLYNGATLLSSEALLLGSGTSTAHDRVNYAAVYPANLNGDSGLTVKPNSTTWTHYLIRGYYGVATFWCTKTIRFVNTPHACKNTSVQVAFHDWRNCCWEFFRFDGRPTPSVNKTPKTYQKTIGDYTGTTFSFNTWDRSVDNYHNTIDEEWTLKSEYLTVEETQIVSRLITSKQVMAYIQGQWLPVIVDTKSFSYQIDQLSKATFAEVKIKIA
jgi:hypothetical protein